MNDIKQSAAALIANEICADALRAAIEKDNKTPFALKIHDRSYLVQWDGQAFCPWLKFVSRSAALCNARYQISSDCFGATSAEWLSFESMCGSIGVDFHEKEEAEK